MLWNPDFALAGFKITLLFSCTEEDEVHAVKTYLCKLPFNIILPLCSALPSGLFPPHFPNKKRVCTSCTSESAIYPAYLVIIDLTIYGEGCKL